MELVVKKRILFVKRQIDQIREDGVEAFYRKVKKFFWLIFMNISAPLAVSLKVNWPKAYIFLGNKKLRRLKRLAVQENCDDLTIKKIQDQVAKYFRTVVDCDVALLDKQDWIVASRALGGIYFDRGKIVEMNDLFQREAEALNKIAKEYQFDEFGIEFLPEFLGVASIGTYEFLDVYIKARILGLRPMKKLVLLVNPKATVNNPCYLDYWRRYITVISNLALYEIFFPLQKLSGFPLNLYMVLDGKVHKGFLAIGKVREQWISEKRPPILTLSDKDYVRGWKCLESLGMKKNDWFVCLHVRERGWKDGNSSEEDFRNANIKTYISAIKSITNAGGWVIRMGDPTMKPLPQMSRVIDYAHSSAKSDWMDVFLCGQCKFFLGTSSGLWIFATAFGRPIVGTNFLPTCGIYYMTSNDLFIPRNCQTRQKKRFISFSELFSPRVGMATNQSSYNREGIEVVENTEEEIKDLVEEALKRFNGGMQYSLEEEKLQKAFKKVTLDCGKLYDDGNVVVNARIGMKFLKKYAGLLPSEEKEELVVNATNR